MVLVVAITVVLVVSLSGVSLPRSPCALVSRSTVATYAPGASCRQEAAFQTRTARFAHWTTAPDSGRLDEASIDVSVELFPTSAAAKRAYASFRQSLLASDDNWTINDHRDVGGTGDRAVVTYATDDGLSAAATSWGLVLTGTALIQLDYSATVRGRDGGDDTALPQKQTEDATLAMARDVLAQLG